jgi:HSP20 family protein
MFKTTVSSTLRNQDAMDILFKNFFNNDSFFAPVIETKIGHPVDIYENDQGLHFEVAGSGLTKDDISITIEGDCLKIAHQKSDEDKCCDVNNCKYLHKGISRKSFNLGYRIAPKFNLSKADAQMTNGLLKITIPFAEEAKPKSLTIK